MTNEDQDMKLSASTSAEVRGNEGVYLDGKTISLTAKKDISISSTRVSPPNKGMLVPGRTSVNLRRRNE